MPTGACRLHISQGTRRHYRSPPCGRVAHALTLSRSAPISMPLIGLTQLARYWVLLKCLNCSVDDLRAVVAGATGHSQGLVSALVLASARSEDEVIEYSERAVGLLFWLGLRSQEAFPAATIDQMALQDSARAGEGQPTPMLAIRGVRAALVLAYHCGH